MQRLRRRQPVGICGTLVVNHDLFGKNALKGVLPLAAGDEVQHSYLALLQPAPADLVRTVDMHSPTDVALVVLQEGPAVDDDGDRPNGVPQWAAGHPLSQLIGVDNPQGGEGLQLTLGETGGAQHFTFADHRRGRSGIAEVGAAGTHLAVAEALAVLLIGSHRTAAGTAASTRQRARGALG